MAGVEESALCNVNFIIVDKFLSSETYLCRYLIFEYRETVHVVVVVVLVEKKVEKEKGMLNGELYKK